MRVVLCCLYLLYLFGLQEITGLSEVGFEGFWLQLSLDGCVMLGVHLFLGGDLQAQILVRDAFRLTRTNLDPTEQ